MENKKIWSEDGSYFLRRTGENMKPWKKCKPKFEGIFKQYYDCPVGKGEEQIYEEPRTIMDRWSEDFDYRVYYVTRKYFSRDINRKEYEAEEVSDDLRELISKEAHQTRFVF